MTDKYIEVRIREVDRYDQQPSTLRDMLHDKFHDGMANGYFTKMVTWFDAEKMQTVVRFYITDEYPEGFIDKSLMPRIE